MNRLIILESCDLIVKVIKREVKAVIKSTGNAERVDGCGKGK